MSKTYTPTIGLEIHAELKTATKMFCNSKNDPDEVRPNVNVCPVCMGFPGTLPVANKEALRHVLKVGVAVDGELADYTEFDRKNYFYPDLPKGYQISQYQFPLVAHGSLNGVAITRVHLEEDTARSQHGGEGWSLIDFNRSGIPLMELVTEPVIHDAETARLFAEELQRLLRTLGAGEANMEKGQMRVEANISISDSDTFGTKVEVKNLNSFKSVEKAILYEIDRQRDVLESGGTVIQETRGWDEVKQVTFSQRMKESSHDYRYFPDPDIPKFRLSEMPEFTREYLARNLPELPWQRRARLMSEGVDAQSIEILIADHAYANVYDQHVAAIQNKEERKIAQGILLTALRGLNPTTEELQRVGPSLPIAARMRLSGLINSSSAAAVFAAILKDGRSFDVAATEMQLIQVSDAGEIQKLAREIISENQNVVDDIKAGKGEAMKYLLGQGMKKSKGSVNPGELENALKKLLAE